MTKKINRCPRASKQKHGYRVGEIGESDAKTVIAFEVEDMGNDHLLDEGAKAFGVEPNLQSIMKGIDKCFGADAQVVWLTRIKKHAKEYYGPGWVDKIKIPKGASIISDLGPDGQLFIYKKQKLIYM